MTEQTEQIKSEVARPIGQIPSGCFVLTASNGGQATGILASWVQQASFKPPTVTVAIKKGRPINDLIEGSGHFVLNLIPENPLEMFKQFGRGVQPGESAFDGLSTQTDPAGIIIQECMAHLSCKVTGQIDAGDHRVYVGEVVGGSARNDARPYVHLRSNGFSY